MTPLRQGATGPEVKALQKKLHAIGYSIQDDGHFGIKTDQALRTFQAKQGLLPDGIVGKITREALDKAQAKPNAVATIFPHLVGILSAPVIYAALVARSYSSFQGRGAQPSVHLKTSKNGKLFIYREEAQPGVSNVLHWPTGDSGVTLGPGYDMKGRTKEKIIADLKAIGISPEVAAKVAGAAGRKGEQAKEFVAKFKKDNPDFKIKDKKDEFTLLEHVLPEYERKVRDAIHVELHQHQFDALVSYAYNVGNISLTANHINRGEVRAALKVVQSVITSGGKVSKALVARRPREVALYLYGDYGKLPTID